jgi:hypothetical protein
VDPAGGGVDQRRQRVEVGALELDQLAVVEDRADHRVGVDQPLERVGLGRPAELGALDALGVDAELVEQQLAELLGRAEVELVGAGGLVGLALELLEPAGDVGGQPLEVRDVDRDAEPLDLGEQAGDRQLDVAVQREQAAGVEPRR